MNFFIYIYLDKFSEGSENRETKISERGKYISHIVLCHAITNYIFYNR